SSTALAQVNGQTEPPRIIRKSGGVLQGSATRRVEPAYPPLARAARVSGAVVVEVTIDEDGKVISARAISGHPLLKDAAVTAAQGWTFQRTELSGVAVKVIGTLTFNFVADNAPGSSRKEVQNDIEESKKLVAATPYAPEAHYALGDANADDDRYEEAIAEYREALRLKPDFKEAYLQLASSYKELGRNDDEVAIYKEALTYFPKSLDILEKLVGVLDKSKKYAEAAEAQTLVVQQTPENPTEYNRLGWFYNMSKRPEEAIAAYSQALHLDPNLGIAYHNIGW